MVRLRAGDGALFDSRRLAGVRWIRRPLSFDVLLFIVAVIKPHMTHIARAVS